MTVAPLDTEIRAIGGDLAAGFPNRARHPLKALDAKAMELSSQDQELKAALFRFVDVTPACRSLDDLARHLAGFLDEVQDRPPSLDRAMKMAGSRAGRTALGAAAAAGVRHMAHRFIVGESPEDALGVLRDLWRRGVAASVDLLGEATVTQEEADRYAERCADAIDTLAAAYSRFPDRPQLERDSARRLRPLLRRARDRGVHLHIDMESLDALETTMQLVFDLLDEDEFADGPSAGIVLQAYLRESPDQLDRILAWASATRRKPPLVVRLVKGAYWDHEVVEARQHGWLPPVFEVKADCDRNFEMLTRRLLEARPAVRVAIGSHNLRSVAHAIAVNRELGDDDRDLELQVLRGLGDDLQHALSEHGFRVRTYCPVGDLVAGMAYLVRRLLENTSNESFLNEQAKGVALEELLAAP